MIHLKLYNESAGQLWREVSYREMATRITGQQVDTFTTTEVRKIIAIVEAFDGYSRVSEYKTPGKLLDITIFGTYTRDLRHHLFDEHTRSTLIYPRVVANNVFVECGSDFYIDIYKSVDDWFYAYNSANDSYYLCDGIQGQLDMLSEKIRPL